MTKYNAWYQVFGEENIIIKLHVFLGKIVRPELLHFIVSDCCLSNAEAQLLTMAKQVLLGS